MYIYIYIYIYMFIHNSGMRVPIREDCPSTQGLIPRTILQIRWGRQSRVAEESLWCQKGANPLHNLVYKHVFLVAPPCSAQKDAKIAPQPRVSSREQSYRAGGEGRAESQKKACGVRK